MLRFAALLALVAAAGCCSAFNLEVSDAVQAYVDAQGEDVAGRQLYFPCDFVSAKEMESLDLQRYQGHWVSTNVAMSTSHHIDSNKFQEALSKTVSCQFNAFNNTDPKNRAWQQVVGLRNAVNASAVVPGWQVVDNGTALYRSLNVTLPRSGNNGKWLVPISVGKNNTVLWIDVLVVATDYTRTAIWYSCQDIPVPMSADTVREQTWGLQRREAKNFNSLELAALKLVALGRGIVDADRLYTMPTDGC